MKEQTKDSAIGKGVADSVENIIKIPKTMQTITSCWICAYLFTDVLTFLISVLYLYRVVCIRYPYHLDIGVVSGILAIAALCFIEGISLREGLNTYRTFSSGDTSYMIPTCLTVAGLIAVIYDVTFLYLKFQTTQLVIAIIAIICFVLLVGLRWATA